MSEERAEYKVKYKPGAKPAEQRKEISAEETLKTIIYIQEAIINVLQQKGIADRSEIMDEVRRLVRAKQ